MTWSAKLCSSCTRAPSSHGTIHSASAKPASFPPPRPENVTTLTPSAFAASTAKSKLAELPLVVKRASTSPGRPECLHLPGEDLVEAEVVADAGQRRAVGGQGDGGQRAAVVAVAADQFLAKVERVAGAAAVARGEDLSALREAIGDELGAAIKSGK